MGRSKVVRKFLYRNFLPPEVKKPRYMLPVFSDCRAILIEYALSREWAESVQISTFYKIKHRSCYSAVLFLYLVREANLCSIAAHSARVAVALGASVEDVLPVRIPFLTHHCTAFSAYAETVPPSVDSPA